MISYYDVIDYDRFGARAHYNSFFQLQPEWSGAHLLSSLHKRNAYGMYLFTCKRVHAAPGSMLA